MGLRDVLRGKRRLAVADPSGEPWRPGRRTHPGEDTVELIALLEGPEPEEPEQDEPDRPTEPA